MVQNGTLPKFKHRTETSDIATWIEPYRKAFVEWLTHHGYSAFTTRLYQRTIKSFCVELGKRPLERSPLEGGTICLLRRAALKSVPASDLSHATFRLGRFVNHLVQMGVASLPQQPTKKPSPLDCLRAEYASYLLVQRGLSAATSNSCLNYFDRFMKHHFEGKLGNVNHITSDHMVAFLRKHTSKAQPHGVIASPSHLRNLFKFLFWSGQTKLNLALSIPSIAHSRAADLPRYVKPEVVEQLIDAVRSDAAIGRRNYAMLLLLSRMGLRAREVIAIQLEDIDWRAGEILIRGKGKRHDRMPLPSDIGEAIVSYIRSGRVSDSLALFVSDRTPHQAFNDAQIVNDVLKKALKITGLKQSQKYIGSHLLRHSLDIDAGLVGDFLGFVETTRADSARSRNTRLSAIRSFFKYVALQEPQLLHHCQRILAMPSKRHEKRAINYLKRVEIEALIAAPDPAPWCGRRDRTLFLLAVQTGLRVSELIHLNCGDVVLGADAHVRCMGKGRKERSTPLRKDSVEALRIWLEQRTNDSAGPLFVGTRGDRLSRDAVERFVARHADRASNKCATLKDRHVTPHVLRHSAAMQLLHMIALWLGHECVETTQIYIHADIQLKEQAVAAGRVLKQGAASKTEAALSSFSLPITLLVPQPPVCYDESMTTVAITLNDDHEQFIRAAVTGGAFTTQSEVVATALDILRTRDEMRRDELKREIQKGIDELDRGETADFNLQGFLGEMNARHTAQKS